MKDGRDVAPRPSTPSSSRSISRPTLLLGLLSAPLVYAAMTTPVAPRIDAGWAMLVAAGLLVGIGTRFGSGCTSGHGVCGLSRLSPRSLVATLAFMLLLCRSRCRARTRSACFA